MKRWVLGGKTRRNTHKGGAGGWVGIWGRWVSSLVQGGSLWPKHEEGKWWSPNERKERDCQEQKKRPKKKKDPPDKKKGKKNEFGRRETQSPGLPERPWGLPFGPQVRPDSGFTYQLWPPFNSYRKCLYHPTGTNDKKTGSTTGSTVVPWYYRTWVSIFCCLFLSSPFVWFLDFFSLSKSTFYDVWNYSYWIRQIHNRSKKKLEICTKTLWPA